ncbi:hypothetical protein CASFOL_026731 [Castilleja foliolosa]|uniref:Pentatricopeptide repeat-containing protein n=1 Tax=Castilleja foliolosa TaxID=1961234 RepID=A0ABD3CJU9_9LAMI
MRNQCMRLLLLRCHAPSRPHISQVHHFRSFTSSLLHPPAPRVTPNPFFLRHHFTSSPELSVDPPKPPSDEAVLLANIFAEPGRSSDEIKLDLDSKNVGITHDLVLSFLKNPETDPEVAKRVFDWVLESQGEKLSSKSYNWMLGILGSRGSVNETWGLIWDMKNKGYGVSRGAFVRISEKFLKDGLSDDVEKLKELYACGSASCKKNEATTISNIIRGQVWGDDVEKQLKELNVKYTSDLVTRVLENLKIEPNKAIIFFRWVQESGLFNHNERSFNAMARVLAEEDHSKKFWRFSNEMRGEGHEMERKTYVHILDRFVKRKMIEDAVSLYEFAMIGGNKPSVNDCTFLLKKIVVSKELDMDLFMKVLGIFKASGNVLSVANLDAVIKSLTSVGKMNECNRILLAMEKAGYVPCGPSRSKIAFKLGSAGKTREAMEFMRNVSDRKTWESLVKGCCEARDLKVASNIFREMIEKEGPASSGHAFDVLIDTYCRKNRPMDAYKFVFEMVKDKGMSPWRSTFKALTSKLLAKNRFKEALDVMGIMKKQDYAPDLVSFVDGYLSKKGSADEAVEFAQAMTSKRFPAFPVFVRLIEAYIKVGRRSEAQDFLAKCPSHVKNNADVLNLFCSGNSDGTGKAAVAV